MGVRLGSLTILRGMVGSAPSNGVESKLTDETLCDGCVNFVD